MVYEMICNGVTGVEMGAHEAESSGRNAAQAPRLVCFVAIYASADGTDPFLD